MEEKKFRRITNGSLMGGVCTGLAEHFDTDVTLFRLLFVLGTVFTVFPFILTYIILWIAVPQKD